MSWVVFSFLVRSWPPVIGQAWKDSSMFYKLKNSKPQWFNLSSQRGCYLKSSLPLEIIVKWWCEVLCYISRDLYSGTHLFKSNSAQNITFFFFWNVIYRCLNSFSRFATVICLFHFMSFQHFYIYYVWICQCVKVR